MIHLEDEEQMKKARKMTMTMKVKYEMNGVSVENNEMAK
jgi:hypothetical protein